MVMSRTDIDEPLFLDSVESTIAGIRSTGFVPDSISIEFPVWMRSAFRANLAERKGVHIEQITTADLEIYFADLGVEPEWDYEDTEAVMTSGM